MKKAFYPRIALALLIGSSASMAAAQAYPDKPIRLVIPQAPGGGSDTIGRFIAQKLEESLGQLVVVENRSGAAGMLGADVVRRSAPDGYTLLLSAIDTITAPLVSKAPPFDGAKDFTPVTQLAQSANVILVNLDFPAKNMQELIAAAKQQPLKIDFASSGVGGMQHLAGELLNQQAGIKLAHVPYKGGPPGFADLVGGRVPVMISGIQGAIPYVRSGKVRALAVTSPKRSTALPDVPTVAEAGKLPGYEAMNWQGLLFPPGTPKPIAEKIATAVAKILAMKETQDKLAGLGYEAVGNTPAQFAQVIAAENKKWSAIVKSANITAE